MVAGIRRAAEEASRSTSQRVQAVLHGFNLTLEIMKLCRLRYESTLPGFKLSRNLLE